MTLLVLAKLFGLV